LVWCIEPGHHGSQFAPDNFDLMLRVGATHSLEARTTGLVFEDPARGKSAVLDFLQDAAHFVAGTFVNDTRTRDIVAVLGSIADRVAHVAHTTLVHEIYNEFHFMHTLKVGHLWLIASL